MTGATDPKACPKRRRTRHGGLSRCLCKPRCAVCGWGEHDAIHGPCYGRPPGSEPWGHEFTPALVREAPTQDAEFEVKP